MKAVNVYLAPSRAWPWLFILLGSLSLVNAGHEALQEPVHLTFLLSLVQGVLFLAIAFTRLKHVHSDRYLRADENGIRITRWCRRNISLPWPTIAAVSVADADVLVVARTGARHQVRTWARPQHSTMDPRKEFCEIVARQAAAHDIAFTDDRSGSPPR